ncbi:serine/threonine protein kinase [Phormidium sp. CCY1219]|uniref:serine/threonine protein kinase n=1 Tax=Phormidium sp. CCY1219 TaxID=2886104 RepID=UPI002D1E8954|nr:serine/threonine-protein kinase [Phormidium sp. CCY1219]MEB3828127.1 serine/threonine protein kinase [Phormidium sp. CCY1219]
MSNFPDFTAQGYQIQKELGHNRAGGRVTYLADRLPSLEPMVIKQFQFATSGADWSAYKAVEREIQILQQLNHPGIPKYRDAFETPDGFCMVQEYKAAQSLAMRRSFDAEEVKQLAIAALEILVYLQTRSPQVIHRDIKPENILVSDRLDLYLVDFGFAQLGAGEVAMSSMVKGTMGFMPPEQLLNRQLTTASDLYGLGASLICLLTGTPSSAIGDLIDDDYRIDFKQRVPRVSLRWIQWLERMVQPDPRDRFPDAATALNALQPIYVVRTPEIVIQPNALHLVAAEVGETLTQTISVKNSVSDTVLMGKWDVAPHPHDPPHTPDFHPWIAFQPATFNANRVHCHLKVDTSQLRAGEEYHRTLRLHSNSSQATMTLPLTVETAAIPITRKTLPYSALGLLFLSSGAGAMLALHSIAAPIAIGASGFLAWAGLSKLAGHQGFAVKFLLTLMATSIGAGTIGFTLGMAAGASLMGAWGTAATLAATVVTGSALLFSARGVQKQFGTGLATGMSLLTAASGISWGIGLQLGLWTPLLLATVAVTGLPVVSVMLLLPWQRSRRLAQYRRSEEHLIKP